MYKKMVYLFLLLLVACNPASTPATATPMPPTASPIPIPTMTAAPTLMPTATAVPISPLCGAETVTFQSTEQATYTIENSGIANNAVRTLAMGKDYLGLGFAKGGVSLFTGTTWHHCFDADVVVNALLLSGPTIWVGTDGLGVSSFSGTDWTHHTETDYRVYGFTVYGDSICATTYTGVYCYDTHAMTWTQKFFKAQGNLLQDHIHAMVLTPRGWFFGSIKDGGTWLKGDDATLLTADAGPETPHILRVLGSNNIRRIVINPSAPYETWFVSDAGEDNVPGVVKYDYLAKQWTPYVLPRNCAQDIAFDYLGRPWVATCHGTFMLNNKIWDPISSVPGYSVAMGCDGCAFPRDVYFIGTQNDGLLQGKIP